MKRILLVGVPIPEVAQPVQEEGKFWRTYLAFTYLKGAASTHRRRFPKLCNSNNIYYGIASLGRELRELGYEVHYLAPSIEEDDFLGSVARVAKTCDVVGLSYHTCAEPVAREIARLAKQINPKVNVLAGGPHCSGLSKVDVSSTPIDLYVRGRAHASLPFILNSLDEIIHAHRNDKIYHREETPATIEHDMSCYSFPVPAADLFNANDIPGARVYTQIGCGKTVPCSFCASLNNNRIKEFGNLDVVFAYIDDLIATKGTCYLYIGDEDFFMNPKHSLKVVNRLDAYKGILTYTVQARMETIRSVKGVHLLKKIGSQGMCARVEIGVENASQDILNLSRKGMRISHLEETASLVHRNGLLLDTYWLGGLPGETEITYKYNTNEIARLLRNGTIDFAKSVQVVPFPGTPIFEQRDMYRAKGIDINICEPPEIGGNCRRPECQIEHWGCESMPVFDLAYKDKPPLTREQMRELHIERMIAMSDALQERILREYGPATLKNLMEPTGTDPLQDLVIL